MGSATAAPRRQGPPVEEIRHIGAIDTVRVLANDERLHLLRLLMRGAATLTQLGAVVGHHPAWVRHHILSLEQAGLVELVETRQTKGYVEKFFCATARAYAVDFMVLPEEGERGLLVILGSDDLALDLLARRLREDEEGPEIITMAMGSLEGLIALRHGLGHVAGCHLFDAESGDFNRSYARALFPGRALLLVTLAHRQQGLDRARRQSARARGSRRRGHRRCARYQPQSRLGHARLARPAARDRRRRPRTCSRLRRRGDDSRRRRARRRRGRRGRGPRHPACRHRARPRLRPPRRRAVRSGDPARALRERVCSRRCSSCSTTTRSSGRSTNLEAT